MTLEEAVKIMEPYVPDSDFEKDLRESAIRTCEEDS